MKKVGNVPRFFFLLLLLSAGGCCIYGCLSGAVKDACTIVASADAEAVLGEPVGPPKSEDRSGGAGPGSMCEFSSTKSKGLSRKRVSVSVQYPTDDADRSEPGIMANLKSGGFKSVREVSGVSDHAIWGTMSMMGKLMGELTVLKGKHTMVIILVTGVPDEATAFDRAKALAAKVLPKT